MYFFKITLNTVAGDNEKILFVFPPAEDTDENGIPVYDEDFLTSCTDYKNYIKRTKANVVEVHYTMFSAPDNTRKSYDDMLKNEGDYTAVDENSYLIEVKKVKPKKSGDRRKTPIWLYAVIGIVIAAVLVLLAYKYNSESSETVPSESSTEEIDITGDSLTETTTPDVLTEENYVTESTTGEVSSVSDVPELVVLTYNKNGGTGALTENVYQAGAVVSLPFSGVSRVGHSLVGWATAPTEPYTLYDNELNRLTMPENPLMLYAVWAATEYEVTYNYQVNGNAVTSKERAKYGEIIPLMDAANIPTGTDGKFVGWGLTPEDTEPVQSVTMPDGGIELYAIYAQ